MTTADPISLAQAQRLAANADTILLRATRPADLETPIGAFLRLDDGGPAYLLESVEGGERLGRYSFLGVGPRRLLEVRDGVARIQTRPVTEPTYSPDLPIDTVRGRRPAGRDPGVRATPPRPADRGDAALHRRCGGSVGVRRRVGLRADRPDARPRPRRRADRRLHRDRPRPGVRPPDPHAVGDRLAPHRGAGPRGSLSDRRDRDLRGARAHLAAERGRAGRVVPVDERREPGRSRATHRDEPRPRRVHPRGRGRQGRHRGGRGDPGRARPAPVVRAADRSGDRRRARRDRALPRAPPRQPEPVPVLHPDAHVRGRRRLARSSCSRSRATA